MNYFLIILLLSILGCQSQINKNNKKDITRAIANAVKTNPLKFDTSVRTIHVFVALCDNKYQGIVPVPAKIGNGQDLENNLYWGCSAGIKTYFKKSKSWTLIKLYNIDSIKLQRAIFKNNFSNYYMIADAYNGKYIRNCTIDFLRSCSGQMKDTIQLKDRVLGIYGNSKLISYIGHDGLMDFTLPDNFQNADNIKRDAIILACISKSYFSHHLYSTKAYPLLWSTGLMCPEAYTLHDALHSYIQNKSNEEVSIEAATAYSKFQKCSIKASRKLLVTGW